MKNSKWLKFSLLYVGAIVLSVSQMKISPTDLRGSLISLLNIDAKQISLYVSIFTFAPILLAIPGGKLVKRFGAKKMSMVIMCSLCLGNILGYFAQTYQLMVCARIIEGISFSFIMITGMVLITNWFKHGGYELAVGIFGTFSAFGYVAVIYILPLINNIGGIKSIWLTLGIVSGIVCLLFWLLFDDPRSEEKDDGTKFTLKEAFSNPRIIMLAIAMMTVSFTLFVFLDGYPTIFKNVYNLPTEQSNFNSMFFGIIGIPFGFLIGYLMKKSGKPLTIGFISFIAMAITTFLTDKTPGALLLVHVTVLSACICFTSTTISASVPKVVKHSGSVENSFAIIYLFYYTGAFLGIPIISFLSSNSDYGWAVAVLPLVAVSITGAILTLPFSRKELSGKPYS